MEQACIVVEQQHPAFLVGECLQVWCHEPQHIGTCAELRNVLAVLHHAAFTNLSGSEDGQCLCLTNAVVAHEVLQGHIVEVAE